MAGKSISHDSRIARRFFLCVLLLLALVAAGCGRGEPKQAGGSPGDSDGDGLSDADETNVYHTSPDTKDTDGDGYDDYQEIRELGFDRSNPTKFNPLVADAPRIKIQIVSAPDVQVTYTRSKGDTKTREAGETVTASTSRTSSRGGEESVSVTAGFSTGLQGGVSGSVTMGASVNWNTQETSENQRALSQMRSYSQSSEMHQEGGQVRVVAAITNTSHIPFTIQNLTLTAALREGTQVRPILQLEADSTRPFFEMGTWTPGERTQCVFIARNVSLADIEKILTTDLIVQVGKYELKDANGQSFGHRTGAIDAACAGVMIGYGAIAPAESYMVSTRVAPDERGVPLNKILDTLGIRSEEGKAVWTYRKRTEAGRLAAADSALETRQTRNGLLSLGGVGTDPQQGGHWVIVHATPSGASSYATRSYDLLESDYRLEDIRLKPRQAVQLTYVRDPDRDGLPTATELALGTDPRKSDTDGDGILDGDEVNEGTDPLRNNALPRPRIESVKLEKLGQQVSVAITLPKPENNQADRLRIEWGDGSLAYEISSAHGTVTAGHHYDSAGNYKIIATPYAGSRSMGEPYEILVSTTPALIRNMTVQFGTRAPDHVHGVALDREGNIYLAGDVSDSTPIASEAGKVFLVKCNRGGQQEWIAQFGGPDELPGGLATDRAGSVYVATYVNRPDSGKAAVLRSFTRSRDSLPSFSMMTPVRNGSIPDDRPVRDVDVAADGTCYVAQERWWQDAYPLVSGLAEDNGPPGVRQQLERLLFQQWLKFRTRGGTTMEVQNTRRPDVGKISIGRTAGQQVLWSAYLPWEASVQAVAADASGGLYVCGYRRLDLPRDRGASKDGSFVARYNPRGELSWIRWHGDYEQDQSVSIAVDARGNVYVVDLAAGRTSDQGRSDVRLVKYDPSGKIVWMRRFGTRLLDVPFSVAVWPPMVPGSEPRDAEAVYVAGVTQGELYNEGGNPGNDPKLNAFLLTYDRDGTRRFLEQIPLGAAVPTEILDPQIVKPQNGPKDRSRTWWRMLPVSAYVATDEQGNVYLAGNSERSLDTKYQNQGSTDIFLVRYAPNPEEKK
jgi:hypothetical protein